MDGARVCKGARAFAPRYDGPVKAERADEFRATERFRLIRRVGAGGAGVVYEAFDREQGARVALKTLRRLSPDALLRFKNEFRSLQDIHHPNLVALGELFEAAGQWFFSMEFVEGVDLLTFVRRPERGAGAQPDTLHDATLVDTFTPVQGVPLFTPRGRDGVAVAPGPPGERGFDEIKLRASLVQLAWGLAALHAAGKVHRDIKPTNIVVTREGRVVVLDFGLVVDTRGPETELERVVGTLQYMAPEQALGLPVGPRADCYSVGVVLYRALTGTYPFDGSPEQLGLEAGGRRTKPAPPSKLVESLPADLEALCLDLLHVTPELRPSAEQILARLDALPPNALPYVPSMFPTPAHFVGREVELALLRDAFEETLRGGTVAMQINGDSGVGKSTLARRFGELVREECGAIVLSGRCYERESVPYKAIDGIVDGLSRYLSRLPTEEARAILPPSSGLLAQVFPVLRTVVALFGGASAEESVDPSQRRVKLFEGVRELFVRLAERLPLVLVVDDLQWSDADSLALLRELVRPPDAPGLLLLATARIGASVLGGAATDADRPPESQVPPTTVDGARTSAAPADFFAQFSGDVRQLRLERLPPNDARELAELLLSRVPWNAETMADDIAREAAGHPLFIDELVRHALLAGDARGHTVRLDDALAERVLRLDPPARRLVELVCLAGAPLKQDVLAHAAEMEFAPCARAVASLRIGNLVRTTGIRRGDAVEPYHDRVRDAILTHMRAEVRREGHRRLALATEALDPGEADALALHCRGAGELAKAASYGLVAAENASRALSFDRAARLYSTALALGTFTPEKARRVRADLAEALHLAGRGSESAQMFLAAAAGASPEDALEMQRRAAQELLISGHLDEGLVVLSTVLEEMGMVVPTTAEHAVASLLVRRGQLRLRGLGFRERRATDVPEDELRKIDLLGAVSAALGMLDTVRGADFQTRHLLLALKAGEPLRIARALALEGGFSATGGTRTAHRTARILTLTHELAQRVADPEALAACLGATAIAAFLEGRWGRANRLFEEALTVLREKCRGAMWQLDSYNLYQLGTLFHLGELRELGRRIPTLLAQAEQRGDLYAMTHLRSGLLSVAWLVRGDPEGARRGADEAILRWSRRGTHLPHFLDVLARTQIELYEARAVDAYERIHAWWPPLKRAMLLRVQFIRIKLLEVRARAALAVAARTGSPEALAEAGRLAKDLDRERAPWADAYASLTRAGVACCEGERTSAVLQLQRAESEFEGAEMALHAAVARRRRGEIVGGAEGDAAVRDAEAYLSAQGVKEPARFMWMLAPFGAPAP
jgi:serine/threonine protein kinase